MSELFTAIDKIYDYVIGQGYTLTQINNVDIKPWIVNNKDNIGLTTDEMIALKHSSRAALRALKIKYNYALITKDKYE